MALREYERGLIALMTDTEPAQATWALQGRRADAFHDLFTGAEVPVDRGRVTIGLEPVRSNVSGAVRPTARVYLKLRAPSSDQR